MKKNLVINKVKSYLADIFKEVPEEKFRLVKVVLKEKKNNEKLQIFVDKEKGITINDCVMITKKLSRKIDNDNDFNEHYILEVSSPGEYENKDKEA